MLTNFQFTTNAFFNILNQYFKSHFLYSFNKILFCADKSHWCSKILKILTSKFLSLKKLHFSWFIRYKIIFSQKYQHTRKTKMKFKLQNSRIKLSKTKRTVFYFSLQCYNMGLIFSFLHIYWNRLEIYWNRSSIFF